MTSQHFLPGKAASAAFFLAWLFSGYCYGLCDLPSQAQVEAVEIHQVYDGDTVSLVDGRKIRMLGINTPEVERGKKPGEPFAEQARDQLQNLLKPKPIYLRVGQQATDRYGRILGHLYDVHGSNITAALLQQGAGFQVAIPPNLSHVDCYSQSEALARQNAEGVWGLEYYRPIASTSANLKGGYARIIGRVESVSLSKKNIWIDLEGQVTLKLEQRYAEHLAGPLLDSVVSMSHQTHKSGLVLEAQGWLSDRLTWSGTMPEQVKKGHRKRFQMKIQHKSAWKSSKTH